MADFRTKFLESAFLSNLNKINNDEYVFTSSSPEDTFFLGEQVASVISEGCTIALTGTLGSGKTQLTKGIAFGLGIDEKITSPTYTIVNEYHLNSIKFIHIDSYRLNDDKDFEDIGGTEILNSGAICVIEWSDRISGCLPENVINISIEINGSSSRLIKIFFPGNL